MPNEINRRCFLTSALLSFVSIMLFSRESQASNNFIYLNDLSASSLSKKAENDFIKLQNIIRKQLSLGNNTITIDKLYYLNKPLLLPDGLNIIGKGKATGFVFINEGSRKTNYGLVIKTDHHHLDNFGVYYTSSHYHSNNVGTPDFIGIFLSSISQKCVLSNLHVENITPDKYFFSHCIRVNGNEHKVSSCEILNGSMCLSMRGTNHVISANTITNDFIKRTGGQWNTNSHIWDGIAMEGCINCSIIGNTVHDCGQSGIYCGGNNSVSKKIIVSDNIVYRNWNRGIDFGVTGIVSGINSVGFCKIYGNEVYDNREAQIWLNNVNDAIVTKNKVFITNNYLVIFDNHFGGMVGIALGNGGHTNSNKIIDNSITTIKECVAAITIYGFDNIIKDNKIKGKGIWYSNKTTVLKDNVLGSNFIN